VRTARRSRVTSIDKRNVLPAGSKGLFSRTINAVARNKWQRQREKKRLQERSTRSRRFNEQGLPREADAQRQRRAPEFFSNECVQPRRTWNFMLGLIIYNPFSKRSRRDGRRTGEFMERNFDEQITRARTFGYF
jgi:hypothetical protein